MSGNPGEGCRIMRCPYLRESACTYAGYRCRYHIEEDDCELRLKLALDALGEISDAYGTKPTGNDDFGASEMRDIANSALRRLSLKHPD